MSGSLSVLPLSFLVGYWRVDISYQHSHEYFKSVRWINIRNLPTDHLPTVSGVDCLDLISQTHPGQERLKKLTVDLSHYVLMLFMGGSLLRILRRMHGIQSLELQLVHGWQGFIPPCAYGARTPKVSSANKDWLEHFGRDFLLLIKNELGHINVITLRPDPKTVDKAHIPKWISHELEKRNKAWVPPPPAYMNFHRTTSSMSVVHSEIIKKVTEAEDSYKPERHTQSISYLENNYGVFS